MGTPLKADLLTATIGRMSFARVLIEVDVNSNIPDFVPIKGYLEKDSVAVTYEWYPAQCPKCSKWGHKESLCPKPGVQVPLDGNGGEKSVVEEVEVEINDSVADHVKENSRKQQFEGKQQIVPGKLVKQTEKVDEPPNTVIQPANTGCKDSENAVTVTGEVWIGLKEAKERPSIQDSASTEITKPPSFP